MTPLWIGHMEQGTGTVTSVVARGTTAVVSLDGTCSTESTCHGCSGCTTRRTPLSIHVYRDGIHPPPATGQRVCVHRFAPAQLFSAIMIFGMPLLLGIGAGVAWQIFHPGTASEGDVALAVVSGLAVGALMAILVENTLQRLNPAKITAIIEHPNDHSPTGSHQPPSENRSRG